MYIPKELRLNEFKLVAIPENKYFFGRPESGRLIPDAAYTGEDTAVMPQNKLDSIVQADAEFRDMLSKDEK